MTENITAVSARKRKRPPDPVTVDAAAMRIKDNHVSVFLGAGVSVPFNLPSWNSLLAEMADSLDGIDRASFLDYLGEKGVLRAARLLRAKALFPSKIVESVKAALYRSYDTAFDDPNLNSIIDFCERHRGRLGGVFTYNYEEIFEDQYRKRNPAQHIKSCHSKDVLAKPNNVNVYHLHGFIPLQGQVPDEDLILSEESYNALYSEGLSWRNRVQIHAFESSVCIFLGLSFDDPNMRRLLDYTRLLNRKRGQSIRHIAVMRRNTDTRRHALEETMFHDMGIDPIFFNTYSEIADIMNRL
jgi:hypothetical protein